MSCSVLLFHVSTQEGENGKEGMGGREQEGENGREGMGGREWEGENGKEGMGKEGMGKEGMEKERRGIERGDHYSTSITVKHCTLLTFFLLASVKMRHCRERVVHMITDSWRVEIICRTYFFVPFPGATNTCN